MAYEYYGSLDGQGTRSDNPMTGYATQYNDSVDPVVWDPTRDRMTQLGPGVDSYNDVFRYIDPQEQLNTQAGYIPQPRLELEEPQGPDITPQGDDWDYVVEVWPGTEDDDAEEGLKLLADHIYQVNAAFEKKNLDYHLAVQNPISLEDWELFGLCRRYVLPRQYRDSERSRLQFLQIFNCDRPYNKALKGYRYKMGVSYESRNPLPTSAYSPPDNNHDPIPKIAAFNPLNPNGDPTLIPSSSSPTPSTSSPAPTTPPNRGSSPLTFEAARAGPQRSTQPRMKPIPKPQRQVVKNLEGKFVCTWPDCTSTSKEFSRKCEWSKHMDKHERPYKCLAAGCENVPGFTYSGGLLRHEREVHRKHGGPKNPLYCPHRGCKRHKDSSFARLENLNEHLRRCHTPNCPESVIQGEEPDTQHAKLARTTALPAAVSPVLDMASPRTANKRKAVDDKLREEIKRLRLENQELKRKIEAGYLQQSAMMEQIDMLEKERSTLLRQQSPL
ncbi:hypothetical protein GGS21DRAFT_492129 [Xylaria nigripes]|nr:hypothetical protein GGS21DRAFT_492129 [Xylaria nigripes]